MKLGKLITIPVLGVLFLMASISCLAAEGRWERLNLTGKDQWWYVVDNLAFKDTREYQEYIEKTQKPKQSVHVAAPAATPSNNVIINSGQVQGVWFCKSTNQYVSKLADQKCPVPWIIK